ncbi:uncharacterized protein LOC119728584 [Patiria miniata]|uniref:Uncharacterized protein n=1 Tax=Patiria miniata TaxID=46514 RepID=A0A913ZZ13_PATMI|nr:uncharacterized protein LOC119728584 [Patiria miniata]XP_038056807.1 uncharacterized protein LOC119728584 [Patiria miniata]
MPRSRTIRSGREHTESFTSSQSPRSRRRACFQPHGVGSVDSSSHIRHLAVSRFGELHEPMAGMHRDVAMGDVGGMPPHGMTGVVWNPVATMQLHCINPKMWGAWIQ